MVVLLVVDRVIRFHAARPVLRVLVGDHGLALVAGAELEPLVLDDAGELGVRVRVVDHCVALVIILLERFGLKLQAAVLKRPELVIEELVDHAGVDNGVVVVQVLILAGQEVGVE